MLTRILSIPTRQNRTLKSAQNNGRCSKFATQNTDTVSFGSITTTAEPTIIRIPSKKAKQQLEKLIELCETAEYTRSDDYGHFFKTGTIILEVNGEGHIALKKRNQRKVFTPWNTPQTSNRQKVGRPTVEELNALHKTANELLMRKVPLKLQNSLEHFISLR